MMRWILAVSAALFMYSLVLLTMGYRQNKEERLLKKRLNAIKKLRRYEKGEQGTQRKEWRLDLSWIKIPAAVERDLKTSGLKIMPQEFLALWALAVFFLPLLLIMLGMKTIVCMGGALVGGLMPLLLVRVYKKKRVDKFQQQLGETLLILSSTVRAGITFERALLTVAEGLPAPISEELVQTGNEIKIGTSVEEAMESMALRMQNSDLTLVTSAVLIQKRVGGNLADILDNIAGTVKDRIEIQRNIKTVTAQGRASAQLVGVLPLVIVMVLSVISPGYMDPMFNTPLGQMMLFVAVVMEAAGFFIMLKMTNIKF